MLLVACPARSLMAQQQDAPGPNFIVIMADDLGYGDLSCYWKDSPAKTPRLDQMASQGIRFTDFHSSGNVCSPTRAGLVTGRYQQRSGIPGVINADPNEPVHHTGLGDEEVTFAEMLRGAGYRTGIMGKWHLGYRPKFNPIHHGFDEFRGYISGNIDYQSHYDRMETYDWYNGTETVKEPGYVTHLVTQHSIDFIRRHRDRPFCLYVAHEAVHAPWQGPEDPPQRGPQKANSGHSSKSEALPKMLTALDDGVGQILDVVDELGLAERTLVVFFSDNGPAGGSAGPLRGRKGSNWEGGHRVPAIARWPGKIAAGTTTDQLAISLDLMPTMLALAGIPAPQDRPLDGVDLMPVLQGKPLASPRQLFWNGVAMRDGTWKLMLNRKGRGQVSAELYQLSDDVGELRDLAAQYPDRVQQMKAALESWKQDVTPTEAPSPR